MSLQPLWPHLAARGAPSRGCPLPWPGALPKRSSVTCYLELPAPSLSPFLSRDPLRARTRTFSPEAPWPVEGPACAKWYLRNEFRTSSDPEPDSLWVLDMS